ncbi:hypothetical protein KKE60_07015 [Patescibacteria group bacterium]|nr:hypothetical protein [Patescibacteria group bacterium]
MSKSLMTLSTALHYAHGFEDKIKPYCEKTLIVGSIRRMERQIGDVELCVIPKYENGFNILNLACSQIKGLVVDGERLKRFKYDSHDLQIELYITNPAQWGRMVAIRTGSVDFSHGKLAITWNRLGWCGTVDGLRRKSECEKKGKVWKLKPEFKDDYTRCPEFPTEESFFEFLGIEYIQPDKRSWHFNKK